MMPSDHSRCPFTRVLLAIGFVSLVIVGIVYYPHRDNSKLPVGVSWDQYQRAKNIHARKFGEHPDQYDVLSVLGEMAVSENKLETALALYQEIPTKHQKYGLSTKLRTGEIFIHLNRAAESEQAFQEFLIRARSESGNSAEDLRTARSWLCYLYSVQMRFEERKPILAELHESESASVFESKQFFFPSLLIWNSSTGRERLRQFLEETPDDPLLNIAEGRYLTGEGRLEEALALLVSLRNRMGDDKRSISAILECLFENNDWSAFSDVMKGVSHIARDDPWLLTQMRGEYALHRSEWEEAIVYFKRLLEEDSTNTIACMGMSRAYRQLGLIDESKQMQFRSLTLARIRPALSKVTETDFTASEDLARECEILGLEDAAETFREHARRIRNAAER